MNCPNCGAELSDGYVKFCPKCGTRLQNNDVSSEFRLQKAFVPELEYDKNNTDKTMLSVSIKGIPINFNYEKSMYIMIRKPIDLRRSKWKYDLSKYIRSKKDDNILFRFEDFKRKTIPYFNKGKDDYIFWVTNHIKDIILNASHFIRNTYRKPIEETINYSSLEDSVSQLSFERLVDYMEEWKNRPREAEVRRHSQAFRSLGGFGAWEAVKGEIIAGALNYTIDAAGALFNYAGQVKENFETAAFLDKQVKTLEDLMLLSCDCAADRIANYSIKQCMELCKLTSMDSTHYIGSDEFNKAVFLDKENIKPVDGEEENILIERACKILESNPYNFAVLQWLYHLNPSLDEDILEYGKFFNIEDVVETIINEAERERFEQNVFNPFLNTYRRYSENYFGF